MATSQPAEVGRCLVAVGTDGQFVAAEHHQLLQPSRLEAHAALTVDRVGERAAREHQAPGRSPVATLSTAWLSHR